MKLIEALKELPILEKRIQKNCEIISEHAGVALAEESPYGSEMEHRLKIESLVQANLDLATHYEKLKRAIHMTNSATTVTIDGVTKTVDEWITFRTGTGQALLNTYRSLNMDKVNNRSKSTALTHTALEQGVAQKRMYDQERRDAELDRIMQLVEHVPGALEVVNATTDLIMDV